MTNANMTPEQENASYADPDNQVPEGPPVRRRAKLSKPVPVWFPEDSSPRSESAQPLMTDRFQLDPASSRTRTRARGQLTVARRIRRAKPIPRLQTATSTPKQRTHLAAGSALLIHR